MKQFDVLTLIPTGICVIDADYKILFWNKSMEEFTNIRKKDIIKDSLLERFPIFSDPIYKDRIDLVLQDGLPSVFSSQIRDNYFTSALSKGKRLKQNIYVTAIPEEGVDSYYALFSVEDITEISLKLDLQRKLHLQAIDEIEKRKEAENKYRDLFDNSSDFLFTFDLKGIFTDVNNAAESLTGYSRDELIGKSFKDYVEKENHNKLTSAFKNVFQTGVSLKDYPFDVIIKDKSIKRFEVNLSLLKKEEKIIGYQGSARDVTQRFQMLEALHDSEEKFRSISNSARDAIIMIDNEALVSFWNPAAEQLFQYTKKEAKGKDLHILITKEDYHEAYREGFRKFRETGKGNAIGQTLELTAQKKDGTEFPVALSLSGVKLEGKWNAIGIVRDISLQKQIEDKLIDQSDQLQVRNEDLDAYAHSVAHDLKNPLGLVIGYADLISSDFNELTDDEKQIYVNEIRGAGNKMLSIIDNLLILASLRKSEVTTNGMDMGIIVDEVIHRLKPMIEKSNASISFTKKWPRAMGYSFWIEEVWVNYLTNAIKYGGESPRIELGSDTGKSKNIPEGFVRFWVRDYGPGIDPKNQKRLFLTFEQQEADANTGHGLGLSIVKRIVEKLGGEVDVVSEVSKGSTFYFTLPTG